MPKANGAGTAKAFVEQLQGMQSDTELEKISKRMGDEPIIGVRMKEIFDLAKAHTDMDLDEVEKLLESPFYEARMGAVSILDFKARRPKLTDDDRRALYDLYLRRHDRIDTWDLVDRAAPRVIGWYLLDKSRDPLFKLAKSSNAWERRTAITASFWLIRNGDVDDALKLAAQLISDKEHFVNTSVGVALREVGKVDADKLIAFLEKHGAKVPRVTFRYATEQLPAGVRKKLAA